MNNNDFNKFARANECECFKCLAAAENNLMRGIFELGYLLHLAKIMFFLRNMRRSRGAPGPATVLANVSKRNMR